MYQHEHSLTSIKLVLKTTRSGIKLVQTKRSQTDKTLLYFLKNMTYYYFLVIYQLGLEISKRHKPLTIKRKRDERPKN